MSTSPRHGHSLIMESSSSSINRGLGTCGGAPGSLIFGLTQSLESSLAAVRIAFPYLAVVARPRPSAEGSEVDVVTR